MYLKNPMEAPDLIDMANDNLTFTFESEDVKICYDEVPDESPYDSELMTSS